MSNEAITWAYQQPVTTGAKFVLVALADLADEGHSCYPGQAKLASMTGQGERTVRRQLLELQAAGYITRARRFDKAGHRTSDRYVLPVGQAIPTGQIDQRPNQPVAKLTSGQTDLRPSVQSLPAIDDSPTGQNGQVSLSEPKEEPSDSSPSIGKPARVIQVNDCFEEFWKVYPKKQGKLAALAKYRIAVRKTDPAVILAGAQRYRESQYGVDPQFTKNAEGWLTAGRWSDEVAAPAAALTLQEITTRARIAARAADPLASAR